MTDRSIDVSDCRFSSSRKMFSHLRCGVNSSQVISRNCDAFSHLFCSFRGLKSKNQLQRLKFSPIEEINGIEKGFKDLVKPFGFTVLVSAFQD